VRIAVLALLVLTSSARADDKDPDTALALSLGGTAASFAAIGGAAVCYPRADSHTVCDALAVTGVAGLVLAPSLGHWYSGTIFPRGLWMRALGATSVLFGTGLLIATAESDSSSTTWAVVGGGLFLAGGGLALTGIIDDLVEARSAATRYNDAHRVQVMPTVLNPPSGPVMGIGVSGRF
jgi:hypothetical protein